MDKLPAVEDPKKIAPSRLIRINKPRYLREGVAYCKCLSEHFPGCDAATCKHMGKSGPVWILQKLGHDVSLKLTLDEICRLLSTSTKLFSSRI